MKSDFSAHVLYMLGRKAEQHASGGLDVLENGSVTEPNSSFFFEVEDSRKLIESLVQDIIKLRNKQNMILAEPIVEIADKRKAEQHASGGLDVLENGSVTEPNSSFFFEVEDSRKLIESLVQDIIKLRNKQNMILAEPIVEIADKVSKKKFALLYYSIDYEFLQIFCKIFWKISIF
uniref:V-type proton ATPase subunit a n=1 Tax=Ascaris lumbricoides TaxID=6252 RepID=A0A0M3IXJ8_ASCLU